MNSTLAPTPPAAARLAAMAGLLGELGDLKRIRAAGLVGSWAQHAFVRAWTALASGEEPTHVTDRECAAALAGVRLAPVDGSTLIRCGLTATQACAVLGDALDEVGDVLHPAVAQRARAALAATTAHDLAVSPILRFVTAPRFVMALCEQPRAGATAPGRARVIVEPVENHAEHCWAVAVYGALLAPDFCADHSSVFLLGLAHHVHNAVLPDAGFRGETLLGEFLEPTLRRLTRSQLSQLPAALGERLEGLLALRTDADTGIGRAFHAADVLDRVLQVHHHARAAAFTAEQALVDLKLVHDSPVSGYQHSVLEAAGLSP
jgi:5'-deoxynucleotidase YfbR-like HD superfamily hydrolase